MTKVARDIDYLACRTTDTTLELVYFSIQTHAGGTFPFNYGYPYEWVEISERKKAVYQHDLFVFTLSTIAMLSNICANDTRIMLCMEVLKKMWDSAGTV